MTVACSQLRWIDGLAATRATDGLLELAERRELDLLQITERK
jgi:hypothetical protein